LLHQKLRRRFESDLEDEKQGILQANEDLAARHKKTQQKNNQLQNQIKK
jgi:hypothetical protein